MTKKKKKVLHQPTSQSSHPKKKESYWMEKIESLEVQNGVLAKEAMEQMKQFMVDFSVDRDILDFIEGSVMTIFLSSQAKIDQDDRMVCNKLVEKNREDSEVLKEGKENVFRFAAVNGASKYDSKDGKGDEEMEDFWDVLVLELEKRLVDSELEKEKAFELVEIGKASLEYMVDMLQKTLKDSKNLEANLERKVSENESLRSKIALLDEENGDQKRMEFDKVQKTETLISCQNQLILEMEGAFVREKQDKLELETENKILKARLIENESLTSLLLEENDEKRKGLCQLLAAELDSIKLNLEEERKEKKKLYNDVLLERDEKIKYLELMKTSQNMILNLENQMMEVEEEFANKMQKEVQFEMEKKILEAQLFDSGVESKAAVLKEIESLRSEIVLLHQEKGEKINVLSLREAEVDSLKMSLEEERKYNAEMKKLLDDVVLERDGKRKDLELSVGQMKILQNKVLKLEDHIVEVEGAFVEERQERIEFELREKILEAQLVELEAKVTKSMVVTRKENESLRREVNLLQQEKLLNDVVLLKSGDQEKEVKCLQNKVLTLEDHIVEIEQVLAQERQEKVIIESSKFEKTSMELVESDLRRELVVVEEANKLLQNSKDCLQKEVDLLKKELEVECARVSELKEESKSFELERREEKMKLQKSNAMWEIKTQKLQEKISRFDSVLVASNKVISDHLMENKELKEENIALIQTIEQQKATTKGLRKQIKELKKLKDCIKERDETIDNLTKNVSSVERNIVFVQQKLNTQEKNLKTTRMLYGRALAMTRGTAKAMLNGNLVSTMCDYDDENIKEVKAFAKELEAIKKMYLNKDEEVDKEVNTFKELQKTAKREVGFRAFVASLMTAMTALSIAYGTKTY